MQVIRDFLQHKLRFQKYYNESDFTERDLFEHARFKTQTIAKGEDIGIDCEGELLLAIKPFLYRLFSECKNHNHRGMLYGFTNFQLSLCRNNEDPEILIFEGNADNGEPFNENDIDFVRVESCGQNFKKPFGLRLYVCNVYERLLPVVNIEEAPTPARIQFYEDHCVICATNKPNILYSSCRRVCICRLCDDLQSI